MGFRVAPVVAPRSDVARTAHHTARHRMEGDASNWKGHSIIMSEVRSLALLTTSALAAAGCCDCNYPDDTDTADTNTADTDTADTADTDTGIPGIPPLVIDTNVQASALAVATHRAITATFDLPMDADSVLDHFEISPSVPLVTPYFDVEANTVVFAPAPLAPSIGIGPATPAAFLAPDTTYTVTVMAGAEDLLGVALEDDYVWSFTTGTTLNELPVHLGLTAPVALMGGAVVGTPPPTALTGDLASIGALSGFTDLAGQVSGTVYSPAGVVVPPEIIADYDVVYADAKGRNTAPILPFSDAIATAAPLPPGLYYSAPAVTLSSDIILDAGNDRDATFIFQVVGAFGLAAGVEVILQNGADPANVFWQSDGALALGANAVLRGMVVTPAAVTTGADVHVEGGRILTKAGAVTLGAANVITIPE